MFERPANRAVWLIDRRDYWREPFTRALTRAGFSVIAIDSYAGLPEPERKTSPPDLVVLVCSVVAAAELEAVRRLARQGHYVLALVAVLPAAAMRELFLAGAFDVRAMPVRGEKLVEMVIETLEDVRSSREQKVAAIAGLR